MDLARLTPGVDRARNAKKDGEAVWMMSLSRFVRLHKLAQGAERMARHQGSRMSIETQ
jgi:hypothetical protein